MYKWPRLHIRMGADGPMVVDGPVRATFGNSMILPGESVPSSPYAEWEWDGTRLTARTDRYGFFALFYYQTRDEIIVSPSLVEVLDAGVPNELDDAALAVVIRTGFLMGNDTVFKHIRTIPPHGILTWESGVCSARGEFVSVPSQSLPRTQALEGFNERFRASVSARPTDGRLYALLSGGRDSRHIFLELCAQGRRPEQALTISAPPNIVSNEVPVAAQLAQHAGIPHVVLDQLPSRWSSETTNTLRNHFATLEHWWYHPLLDYLKTLEKPITTFEGVLGDLLSTVSETRTQARLLDTGRLEDVVETLLPRSGYVETLLNNEQRARSSRDAARARVLEELKLHMNAARPLTSFLIYNRARRVTGLFPSSMLSAHATVWCPFLDAELFDYLFSLPIGVFAGRGIHTFHDEAISMAYPDAAHIPYATRSYGRQHSHDYELRMIGEMMYDIVRHSPWLLRRSKLYPRLLRGVFDAQYRNEIAGIVSLMSYLTQLSRVSEDPRLSQ